MIYRDTLIYGASLYNEYIYIYKISAACCAALHLSWSSAHLAHSFPSNICYLNRAQLEPSTAARSNLLSMREFCFSVLGCWCGYWLFLAWGRGGWVVWFGAVSVCAVVFGMLILVL